MLQDKLSGAIVALAKLGSPVLTIRRALAAWVDPGERRASSSASPVEPLSNADLDAIQAAIDRAQAFPWVADIDLFDPRDGGPDCSGWTGKFYCGDVGDGTWCTHNDEPHTVANLRFIELMTRYAPRMIAALRAKQRER